MELRRRTVVINNERKTSARLRLAFIHGSGVIRKRPLKESAVEHAKRQDVRRLLRDIKLLREEGTFAGDKSTAVGIAVDIIKNASAVLPAKGRRYSEDTKAWLSVLRTAVGVRGFNIVSLNLGAAHERSARRWVEGKKEFNFDLTDESCEEHAHTYTALMGQHGLVPGEVPVTIAEDESQISPKVEFDSNTKTIVGYCGEKCAANCDSAAQCLMYVARGTVWR